MKAILIFIVGLLCGFSGTSRAEGPQTFHTQLLYLKSELPESPDKACQATFDLVWSWAKKGDLEARADMSDMLYPSWPGLPQMFMPGRSQDKLSSNRDAIILRIHSLGVHFADENDRRRYEQNSQVIYAPIEGTAAGSRFWMCLESKKAEECRIEAAAKEYKLVPTFEEYAAEIDFLIEHGYKPACINFFEDVDLKKVRSK